MAFLPEKLSSRGEVRGSIASQFWDQPAQSAKCLDGLVRTLPCEPPPLQQCSTSGLSRTQQLVAAQALDLPFFPSYVASEGGLVCDRACARIGGKKWWSTVSGRARLQRMLKHHRVGAGAKDVFKDLNNYGLCARTHYGLGRNTTWNAIVEVPNVEIARAVYWQPKAQKHDRTSQLTAASDAGSSKHVTATLTASSSEEQPAKLSLHSRAEGASASSPAPEGSTVEGSSNAAGLSGSIQAAQPVMQRPSSAGGHGGPPAELCPSGAPAKGRTWLKHQVAGHNLLASLAWNEEYLDSAAAYCRVPLSSSLDVASQNRQDGIQYRVGVHHVAASQTETGDTSGPWRSSLHFQGAVAVEGEALVWKPVNQQSLWDSTRLPDQLDSRQDLEEPFQNTPKSLPAPQQPAAPPAPMAEAQPPTDKSLPIAVLKAAAGEAAGSSASDMSGEQPTAGAIEHAVESVEGKGSDAVSIPYDWAVSIGPDGAAKVDGGAGSLTVVPRGAKEADVLPKSDQAPRASSADQPTGKDGFSTSNTSGSNGQLRGGQTRDEAKNAEVLAAIKQAKDMLGQGPMLAGVEAKSINTGLQKVSKQLKEASKGLAALTSDLAHGGLATRLNGGGRPPDGARGTPYSPWLAQPFLKVNAAVGCLARMPLPHGGLRPIQATPAPPSRPRSSRSGPKGHNKGLPAGGSRGSQGPIAAGRGRAESLRSFGREVWAPYLADTLLRVFASASISGQLGRFTRPMFDYTAGSVRVDLGLTSPQAQWLSCGGSSMSTHGSSGASGADPADTGFSDSPFKHRAFALEGRGIWHALSVSAVQQVYGPVRARADFRFALESPPAAPSEDPGRATLEGAWKAIRTLRATKLESVFGLDCVVPNSQGAARIAAWWSPLRKEAMMELRLF
ncbi:g2415 [Coccomyxa elongata]